MLTAVRYTAPGNTCENRIARPEDTQRQQTMLMPHPQRGRATSEKNQPTDPSHVLQCLAPSGRLAACVAVLLSRGDQVAVKFGRRSLAADR
jgi:hypothetical protein